MNNTTVLERWGFTLAEIDENYSACTRIAIRLFEGEYDVAIAMAKKCDAQQLNGIMWIEISEAASVDPIALMHLAAIYNDTELLEVLLDKGCDINVPDARDQFPIMHAINCESYEAFDFLLSRGAQFENIIWGQNIVHCKDIAIELGLNIFHDRLERHELYLELLAKIDAESLPEHEPIGL